jgi:UDP-N-acetyl-2-amino-2-deoxyglucuronate dehydrogenase
MDKKTFALIGAAGYIAPRHMQAIADNGGELVAALDKHDCVGVIDRYFPEAAFFTEFERFDRHIDKLRRKNKPVDYLSVCSPNYLHDSHIRFGIRSKSYVICEKPLVLSPWNLDALVQLEKEFQTRVFTIQQLRLHPSVIALKDKINQSPGDVMHEIELTYITSRGNWYYASWKGDREKSGGIVANIGIHFFDLLLWIFGSIKNSELHIHSHDRAAGYMELEKARVKWFLSISRQTLPTSITTAGKSTYRSLIIDEEPFEFSDGFESLHSLSYDKILRGEGFGIEDARPSLELVYKLNQQGPTGVVPHGHPLAHLPMAPHPFYR